MTIETYVEPAEHWGWIAVAYEPIEVSKWYFPPRHLIWRPTKRMAHAAIPKAVAGLERNVARRERHVAEDVARKARREPGT